MLGVTQHWVCRNNPETRDDVVELVGVGVGEHAPVGGAGHVDAVYVDTVVAAHIVVDCANKRGVVVAVPEVENRLPVILPPHDYSIM